MNNYRTADTWLAAFLIVNEYELLDVDVSNPRCVVFVFEPHAIKMVRPYYNGAQVVALKFARQIRRLKEELYERIGENDTTNS